MFELPEVPNHTKTVNSVPKIFKQLYNYLENDDDEHFELEESIAEKVNRVVHHPVHHSLEMGENLHHLKFNYGVSGVAHKTELLVHTELMANGTIVNLYNVM